MASQSSLQSEIQPLSSKTSQDIRYKQVATQSYVHLLLLHTFNLKRHLPSASFYESLSHRRSRLSVSKRTQPSITRSARLTPLPRAARCKSPLGCLLIAHEVWRLSSFSPANFANSAILSTDKISAFFMQNLLIQKPKDSSWSMPLFC